MAGSPKVTFESFFCVFEFSGVSGFVGEMAGHNPKETFTSCYRTPGPQKGFGRVSERVSEGVSEGFLKGFRLVLEESSADRF